MTVTARLLWLDGELVPTDAAGAPLMGHAVQRGSLVFDVGSFRTTARGPALFRAKDHAARFLRSARIVGLELAFDEAALVAAAVRVVAESGQASGAVRWSAFFAAREADLVPKNRTARVAVAAQALDDVAPSPPRSIRVAVFDDARKAAREVLPPDAKAAGAYLGPMLARQRAIAFGADDVVLLDDDGDIAEAPVANAFAVIGETIWTPPLGRVLPGITRDTILALSRSAGLAVREERLTRKAFEAADEAFLTSTTGPIAPIHRINDRELGRAPGPMTTRLLELTIAARRGAVADRDAWLTYIV
jgi:branched-chain amino acid aminotransferase